jgi:hypothetical protein
MEAAEKLAKYIWFGKIIEQFLTVLLDLSYAFSHHRLNHNLAKLE